jgi:hypothetical protein
VSFRTSRRRVRRRLSHVQVQEVDAKHGLPDFVTSSREVIQKGTGAPSLSLLGHLVPRGSARRPPSGPSGVGVPLDRSWWRLLLPSSVLLHRQLSRSVLASEGE